MDEKQHAKQTKQFKEETEKHQAEMRGRDMATHSENHSWDYDHRSGRLVERKKR